jgi:hypothetical protein
MTDIGGKLLPLEQSQQRYAANCVPGAALQRIRDDSAAIDFLQLRE